MNEPDCQVNGYHTTVLTLLEKLKKFLIATGKSNKSCPIDEQMAVGCLLFEYLLPMTEDAYVMEITVDFLEDTMATKEQAETIFKVIDLSLSNDQIKPWTMNLMQILSRKLL